MPGGCPLLQYFSQLGDLARPAGFDPRDPLLEGRFTQGVNLGVPKVGGRWRCPWVTAGDRRSRPFWRGCGMGLLARGLLAAEREPEYRTFGTGLVDFDGEDNPEAFRNGCS